MKRRSIWGANFRAGLIGALLCFLSGAAHAAMSASSQALVSANRGFAFDLLKQIATQQPGSNIFISAYSASTVLQMVSSGAVGTTWTEMQQMLGTIALSQAVLNQANKEIGATIDSKNTNFVLTTANAVWYRAGTPIEPSFIKANEQFYGARVDGLDFSAPASVDLINAWASEETDGKIQQIVTWPIDPTVRLFLANAVYFLGDWENPFNASNTTNRPFYLSGGGQATLPMMEQTADFGYCAGDGYQAVRLPYKGGNLAMYVFLPGPDSSVEDLLGAMDGASWQQTIQTDFSQQRGTVILPKFNLNYSVDLKPPLEALGMETAFTHNADFSKISPEQLFVSAVTQQAVVEVNELGTEAAAVTTVTISTSIAPPPPTFEMIVDHPFLFFIQDEQAETILFMGMVFDP